MKLFIFLLSILCLFKGSISQGFIEPFNEAYQSQNNRRQLSVAQQSNILTDVHHNQQQHRFQFNRPNTKSQYIVQQSPSVELPVNVPSQQQQTQSHQQQQQKNLNNQRFQQQTLKQTSSVRFPQAQQNNFRSVNSLQQQHHTQTNFIPNFIPQSQHFAPHNVNHQRSLQNQLGLPQSTFQIAPQQPQQQFLTVRDQYVQQAGPQQGLPDRGLNSHFKQQQQQQQLQQQQPQSQQQAQSQAQSQTQQQQASQPQQQTQQTFILNSQQTQPQFASIIPQFQSPPTNQPPPQFQSVSQLKPKQNKQQSQQLPSIQTSFLQLPSAQQNQQFGNQQTQLFSQQQFTPQLHQQQFSGFSQLEQQQQQQQPLPQIQPETNFRQVPQHQQQLPKFQQTNQFQNIPQPPQHHIQHQTHPQTLQQFQKNELKSQEQQFQQQQFHQTIPQQSGGQQLQQLVSQQPQLIAQQTQTIPQQQQTQSQQKFQQPQKLQFPIPQTNPNIIFSGSQAIAPQFQTVISPIPKLPVDQETKQKLIEKHEEFVRKQYEKQQSRVREQHEAFLKQQQQFKSLGLTKSPLFDQTTPGSRGRPIIHPSESKIFQQSIQEYYKKYPTTTTTTSTIKPPTTQPKDEIFQQLLQAQRKDIYSQLKLETDRNSLVVPKSKTGKPLGRDELLKQLKAALAEQPQPDLGNKTYDSMDIVLPNGEKVQVIRTTDPNLIKNQGQNILAQKIQNLGNSQELTLPDGKKVEIVKQTSSNDLPGLQALSGGTDLSQLASLYGGLGGAVSASPSSDDGNGLASSAVITSDSDEPPTIEELARRGLIPDGYEIQGLEGGSKPQATAAPPPQAPPKKKATYVYLEEQPDGSFKIQGVKANGEKDPKTSGSEVDSILERIKSGDIKLPPTVKKLHLPSEDELVEMTSSRPRIRSTVAPPTAASTTTTTTTASPKFYSSSTQSPYSSVIPLIHRSSTVHENLVSTHSPISISSPTTSGSTARSTLIGSHSTAYSTSTTTPAFSSTRQVFSSSTHIPVTERLVGTTRDSDAEEYITKSPNPAEELIQTLKLNGLYAMAKYLKQSGLDSILNETGPYTIFVPTDKAFKTLLIQLGGPERAEEKFKANPRLLSGLLLHHVIPGAFEVKTLQDEMTGVSLAGTQLRVNQYTMHDQEWNDVVITTINGAMIANDKKDIKIPQGIAQAIDRVMFPLPVGDLLQTLQSDRENRFTTFLKILTAAGMIEKLQNKGTKTYTVFAPTDKAFNELESDALEKLLTEKDLAEAFTRKHIVSGTLFSAGMRFYQVKDSLLSGKTITLQKTTAGKIKVNEAQMVTSNIPSTNGVIHALDGLL